VVDAGEYAVRGSVFDIYPTGLDHGLRLDFFGDELETLRLFDPNTQRSVQPVETHLLLPASEALLDEASIKRFRSRYRERFGANATGDPLYQAVSEGRRLAGMEHWLPLLEERMVTLFDHLAPGDLVVIDAAAAKAAETRLADIADYRQARTDSAARQPGHYRPLPEDALYLTRDEFDRALAGWPVHRTTLFAEPESTSVIDFGFASARDFTPDRAQGVNIYEAAAKHLAALGTRGLKPIIAAYTTGSRARLASLLAEAGKQAPALAETWQEALGLAASGRPVAVVLPLEAGFANAALELVTEQDILGDRLVRRKKKRKDADAFLAELSALTPGDLVVHMDHGIGRYEGLEATTVGKSPHDCMQLTYAGGDKLYIPVENLDVLSRYGAESDGVALDKLGGEGWQRRKARMRERILEMAGQLMATAAHRALRQADVLPVDPASYGPFVDRFPWDETEDQDRAIDDVLTDMAGGKPMDRLVCGDVGFGKTEVALRAAFVAAMAGHQVAVIAPTTLLARQHYSNFVERFSGFPIEIGRLSRLVPAKEATETRARLAAGTLDIVVGTHALLSKSVEFRRLGLVIVDEEQRFGVTHKEKLKELKADVHVLTLTATPIPRTLQMAMSGLRELSTIQTPPVDRLAVRTYVMPWDDVTMREALMREHQRGGQSFIVVPRIADMAEVEDWLRLNVPEVRFVTAHGQMSPTEVEDRMSAFYDKQYEVLLSTTIIESGIDIPSANTIVLHRADRFGLAQLYQLRGRVGRGKLRAYAYLTYPEDKAISEIAEKRLKVLGDLDRWARASSWPATTSTCAARATFWATNNRAISRKWASSCTSRCSKRRSWRPRRANWALRGRARRCPPDHARRADHDPRRLCARPCRAHGALSPHERCRRARGGRGAGRRDDRPVRPAARPHAEPFEAHRGQASGHRGTHRQDRCGPQGRAGLVPQRRFPRSDGAGRLCRTPEGHGQAAPRQQAGDQPRLGRSARPPQRAGAADQGPLDHRPPRRAQGGLTRVEISKGRRFSRHSRAGGDDEYSSSKP
jgi:transcription-repair coupling factor (superfamily II helicase)